MKKLLSLLLLLPLFCNAGLFYASPTGSGTGTLASPFDLQAALFNPSTIHPGDSIYLLAGRYKGTYTSSLVGVFVRNNPGDRVILDGNRSAFATKYVTVLTINGSNTTFYGLEITNSDSSTRVGTPNITTLTRGIGVEVFGSGCKFINGIVYDTGGGFGAWVPATNSEYYGNIIFNNGWAYPGGLTGHGIYTQNNTGTKSFVDNIICNNFGNGWQVYGSSNAQLNNFYFEGNVCFNDRWLMGGSGPAVNLELNGNFSYKNDPEFGYANKLNDGLTLRNNYFPSGTHLYWWKNVNIYSNTIFTYTGKSSPYDIIFEGPAGQPPDLTSYHSDSNTYAWSTAVSTNLYNFYWNNSLVPNGQPGKSGVIYLPAWRALGKDVNCTFNLYPPNGNAIALSGKKVFVRPNKYDANRWNIIIYNWDKSATVNVGSVLNTGDQYELHNVQNYFGDVITGVYADSLVVPMTGHTVAKPLAYGLEIAPSTFPEFGVFELIRYPLVPPIDSLLGIINGLQMQIEGLKNSMNSLQAQVTSLQTRVSNLKVITTIQ